MCGNCQQHNQADTEFLEFEIAARTCHEASYRQSLLSVSSSFLFFWTWPSSRPIDLKQATRLIAVSERTSVRNFFLSQRLDGQGHRPLTQRLKEHTG